MTTAESELKAGRQQLANYQAALEGLPRKGTPRPFGWLADRIHADPAEAEAIAAGARAILAGGTLTGIARDWERRGLRPHQAPYGPLAEHPWTRSSVREILANPRVAGISVYKGEEKGRGQWEPLLAEETWRAVTEILRNPRFRRPTRGVTSLLGGIAFCRCGNYVTGGSSANGLPAYRCNLETRNYRPGPHVAVKREKVDEHISMAVVDALSAPDAIHLLTPQVEGDVTAADVAAAWEALGLDLRRAVVDTLMTVTLYPSGSGARRFDPGKVLPPGQGIIWKR